MQFFYFYYKKYTKMQEEDRIFVWDLKNKFRVVMKFFGFRNISIRAIVFSWKLEASWKKMKATVGMRWRRMRATYGTRKTWKRRKYHEFLFSGFFVWFSSCLVVLGRFAFLERRKSTLREKQCLERAWEKGGKGEESLGLFIPEIHDESWENTRALLIGEHERVASSRN